MIRNVSCILCNGRLLDLVHLGNSPLANELHTDQAQDYERFPLILSVCQECSHLQNSTLIPEERLYSDYLYVSDTGTSNQTYFKGLAKYLDAMIHPKNALDIGSNDGLFLSFCKTRNMKVLGVDPAKNLAKRAEDRKVPTITAFFSQELANKIKTLHGEFDMITALNCFAHNANLDPILQGVKMLLGPRGVFVVEVVYGPTMLNTGAFDLVYHEHIHHWQVRTMKKIVEANNLRLFNVEPTNTHGGSARFFICQPKAHWPINLNVNRAIQSEQEHFSKLLSAFPDLIRDHRAELCKVLKKAQQEEKKIAIIGYPAKAATYLTFTHVDQFISDIYDTNASKIGRWTPWNKQIKPLEQIREDKPDVVLCLSWNYEKQLRMELKDLPMSWIVPFPTLQIYDHKRTS